MSQKPLLIFLVLLQKLFIYRLSPEGDMTRRMPDNTKMLKILNKELISLEEGIKRMIDHPDFKK